MTPVRMFIAKFGKEVLIDSDHPLAIAQRAANEQEGADKVAAPARPRRGKAKAPDAPGAA